MVLYLSLTGFPFFHMDGGLLYFSSSFFFRALVCSVFLLDSVPTYGTVLACCPANRTCYHPDILLPSLSFQWVDIFFSAHVSQASPTGFGLHRPSFDTASSVRQVLAPHRDTQSTATRLISFFSYLYNVPLTRSSNRFLSLFTYFQCMHGR